jgi:hypothetical protein
MSTGVTKLSIEDCHFTTLPTLPERVSVVLLVPEQTVAEPEMEPPKEIGFTVTIVVTEHPVIGKV